MRAKSRNIDRLAMRLILACFIGLSASASRSESADSVGAPCLAGRIALEIEQSFEDRNSSAGLKVSRGEARTKVPLTFEGDSVRGEASVAMKVQERGRWRGMSCSASRVIDIAWKVQGTISDQCLLDLVALREATERS